MRKQTRLALPIAALAAAGSAAAALAAPPTTGEDPGATRVVSIGAPPLKPLRRAGEPGPALGPLDRIDSGRLVHPVRAPVRYGESGARFGSDRGGRKHEGQDVFAAAGTPLVALRDARVVETGNGGGRGNYVALYSRAARQTYLYLHMRAPARVRPGQRVAAGQRVGEVGCTGSCFGDHLHLEARRGRGTTGTPVDPMPLLRRATRG